MPFKRQKIPAERDEMFIYSPPRRLNVTHILFGMKAVKVQCPPHAYAAQLRQQVNLH